MPYASALKEVGESPQTGPLHLTTRCPSLVDKIQAKAAFSGADPSLATRKSPEINKASRSCSVVSTERPMSSCCSQSSRVIWYWRYVEGGGGGGVGGFMFW